MICPAESAHLKNMALAAGDQAYSILPPFPGPTYQAFLTGRHDEGILPGM